uniref:Uncharacterized protein n=1 Tax=Arundo donax TaxID=35708 RepID=A0A0A8Y8G6_ARUDO
MMLLCHSYSDRAFSVLFSFLDISITPARWPKVTDSDI